MCRNDITHHAQLAILIQATFKAADADGNAVATASAFQSHGIITRYRNRVEQSERWQKGSSITNVRTEGQLPNRFCGFNIVNQNPGTKRSEPNSERGGAVQIMQTYFMDIPNGKRQVQHSTQQAGRLAATL